MISISIPGVPPSSNHAYTNIPGKVIKTKKGVMKVPGGRVLSEEGQKYKKETISYIVRRYPKEMKFFQPDTPYAVYIRLYFPEIQNKGWPKKAENRYKTLDASNRVKLLEDSLKDAGGIDDSQHMFVFVEKRQGQEKTEVFAWNLDKEATPFDDFMQLRVGSV